MNHGRGLLGDAPHLSAAPSTYTYAQQQQTAAAQVQQQQPQMADYQQMALSALFANPPPPPSTQTPPPPPPPQQQQLKHHGMGLLGDSPVAPNIAAMAAAAATRAMFQQQQQNVPLKTVQPTIQARSQQYPKQNRTMLIQQFRKLREVKVQPLNLNREII